MAAVLPAARHERRPPPGRAGAADDTRLKEVSTAPVVYAELSGATHAFDTFGAPRARAAAEAVERFLGATYGDWERARAASARLRRAATASGPAVLLPHAAPQELAGGQPGQLVDEDDGPGALEAGERGAARSARGRAPGHPARPAPDPRRPR